MTSSALRTALLASLTLAACTPAPYSKRPEAPSLYVPSDLQRVAAYAVNEMSPCRIWQQAPQAGLADVSVHTTAEMGSVCDSGTHYTGESAAAYQCSNGRWEIWIDAAALERWNLTEKYIVLAHELGHVLGLGDEAPVSPAYRGIPSIMAHNALDHAPRLDEGLILPKLVGDNFDSVERSHCSANPSPVRQPTNVRPHRAHAEHVHDGSERVASK